MVVGAACGCGGVEGAVGRSPLRWGSAKARSVVVAVVAALVVVVAAVAALVVAALEDVAGEAVACTEGDHGAAAKAVAVELRA